MILLNRGIFDLFHILNKSDNSNNNNNNNNNNDNNNKNDNDNENDNVNNNNNNNNFLTPNSPTVPYFFYSKL